MSLDAATTLGPTSAVSNSVIDTTPTDASNPVTPISGAATA